MRIDNWITQESAIAALNVVPPKPAKYAQFLQKFSGGVKISPTLSSPGSFLKDWCERASQTVGSPQEGFLLNYLARAPYLASPSETHGQGWRLPPGISRKESELFEEALISSHLRLSVDEWLKTGLHADGSESPGQRSLNDAPDAYGALWAYIEKAPIQWRPSSDPSGFSLAIAEPTAYFGEAKNFFQAQQIEANRILAGIMASDWKDRLCKCRYRRCGVYFVHPKPRKLYQHGTFCSRQHSSLAAAEVAMRRLRGDGTQTLIEAAARQLIGWKICDSSWQDDRKLKRKLAGHLCLVIARKRLSGYQQEVHLNWVTRHQSRVEVLRGELASPRSH